MAVGNVACAQYIDARRDPVLCEDVDFQFEVFIVVRDDRHLHGTDTAFYICRVFQNGQAQLAVLKFYPAVVVTGTQVTTRRIIGNINAVGLGAFERRQSGQLHLVGLCQIVIDVQLPGRRCGRGGLLDGTSGHHQSAAVTASERVVLHIPGEPDRNRDALVISGVCVRFPGVRVHKLAGCSVIRVDGQRVAIHKPGKYRFRDNRIGRPVIDLFRERRIHEIQRLRSDGHGQSIRSIAVLIVVISQDLIIDLVCTCIGFCGDLGAEAAGAARQTVHHRAVLCVQHARRDKLLRLAVIGQGIDYRRGDRVGRDAGFGDGQRLVSARYRVAVLGSGKVNVVLSALGEGVLRDVVPSGADLLIFYFAA